VPQPTTLLYAPWGMQVQLHYSSLKMKASHYSGSDLPDLMVSYPTRKLKVSSDVTLEAVNLSNTIFFWGGGMFQISSLGEFDVLTQSCFSAGQQTLLSICSIIYVDTCILNGITDPQLVVCVIYIFIKTKKNTVLV
jgi:hypothetical protein